MVMALRLAAIIYRSRTEIPKPGISAKVGSRTLRIDIDRAWLAGNPLTVTALEEEMQEWAIIIGGTFFILFLLFVLVCWF